jgi:hypothetical protein
MKLNWGTRIGKMQITVKGTARAHWYYWIKREGAHDWRAGYYGFNMEVPYRLTFATSAQARAYCERKDSEALVIEEVRA